MSKLPSLEYVAGFFDGEGSIYIERPKNYYVLSVTITNQNWRLLDSIREQFGGSISTQRAGVAGRNHDCYTLFMRSKIGLAFLEAVYPFLRVKSKQAWVAICFETRKSRLRFSGRHCLTDAEIERRKAAREIIRKMNRTVRPH